MSHFSVLVTGENIEDALAPFIEHDEDGESTQYFQIEAEITAEALQQEYDKQILDGEIKDGEYSDLDDYALEYHGYTNDGKGNYGFLRNPNAKWDWWQLGGRWSGMLKLKDGAHGKVGSPGLLTEQAKSGYVDSALKKDIDIEGMRKKRYDDGFKYASDSLKNFDDIPMHILWDDIDKTHIEIARNTYLRQDSVKQFINDDISYDFDLIFTQCPHFYNIKHKAHFEQNDLDIIIREYAEYNAKQALHTFAIIHEGKWIEKGRMGWWGMVNNAKEDATWDEEFDQFINDLPDETRINIIDCHI